MCGVPVLGGSGFAAMLANAVEDADETVEELVCESPVATTTTDAFERVRPTSPACAAPPGSEAVGDDVGRPTLLRVIWTSAFSGPR